MFLIDDFGRQQCSPKELLNRWILPLEDRHDFLTVASGKKFQVPFEQLIIFSTNLDPKAAGGRRVPSPYPAQGGGQRPAARRVRTDLRRELQAAGHELSKPTQSTTCTSVTTPAAGRPRVSDCRDLLEIVQSICRYRRQPVHLTRDLMVEASASFIAEFT